MTARERLKVLVDASVSDRLVELLEDWDFDDAQASLRAIEHDLDPDCACSDCCAVEELRNRYG